MSVALDGDDQRSVGVPWLTPFPSTGAMVPEVAEQPHEQTHDHDGETSAPDIRHPSRPAVPSWTPGGATQPLTQGDTSTDRILVPVIVAVAAAFLGAVMAVALVVVDDGLAVAALVVAGVGLAIAVGGGVVVRQRLRTDIAEPLIELREAVLRLGAGEPAEHVVGPNDGPLVPVVRAVESAGATVSAATDRLVSQASWGESSRQILDALGFARTDSEVYRVVAEALELVDDEHPSALLMAPSSSSRELHEVAVNTATGSPGCQATHTDNCLAIRRGQVVVTDSSEAINACPQLRGRPGGPCSAVCVPVAVEGHSVGVVHAIAADRHPPEPQIVERLADLSRQVGARIGSLRALESSRAEASTDGLTGLPNRRTLESGLQQMLDAGRGFVAVLADLDKFKSLNDTFGHEAGDRALQLFAKVMQDNVRGHDIVSRVGGEEFVVVYPDMTVQGSIEAIERLRTGLASAVAVAAVQPFTCSFGVTHSSVGATVAEILRVADAGLLRAKELGGDQVIYADQALAAEVFDHGDGTGPSRSV
jgi:diguanylate cyclase (GGDEF)-like protein